MFNTNNLEVKMEGNEIMIETTKAIKNFGIEYHYFLNLKFLDKTV